MLLAFSRAVFESPGDSILIEFQTQQHLHPHRALAEMLDTAREEAGFCREAAGRAVRSLGLNGAAAIGRLTADDLVKLSRTIRRLCRGPSQGMVPASAA
ncbi:MAG: hypothetical protein ACHRHE_05775 [Tepidisphaerales bacterium]